MALPPSPTRSLELVFSWERKAVISSPFLQLRSREALFQTSMGRKSEFPSLPSPPTAFIPTHTSGENLTLEDTRQDNEGNKPNPINLSENWSITQREIGCYSHRQDQCNSVEILPKGRGKQQGK